MKKTISKIKEARILDGDSRYFLNFNHQEIQKQIPELEQAVESGKMLPTTAARKLLDSWKT